MRRLVFILLIGVSLFSFPHGSPLTLCDLALVVWVGVSTVKLRQVHLSPITILGTLWYIIAVISGLLIGVAGTANPLPFSPSDFAFSLARVTFGLGVLLTVKPMVQHVGLDWTVRALYQILVVHTVLVLLGAVLYRFLGTGLGLTIIELTGSSTVRSAGLFAEPAWYSWFTGFGLFIIAQYQQRHDERIVTPLAYPLFFFASAWAAASLSGLLCVGGGLLACALYRIRARYAVLAACAVAVVVGAFLYVRITTQFQSGNLDELGFLEQRIVRIALGEDGSVLTRFGGSYVRATGIVSERPLVGSGIGNNVKAAEHIRLPAFIRVIEANDHIHILPLAALATTGVIGGFVYLLMILRAFQTRSEWLGAGFVLVSISFGGILLSVIWWFFGMADAFQGIAPSDDQRSDTSS